MAEQDLRLKVARGYFDVLQAQDAAATVAAQKEAFEQQLAQATRSYEVGLSPVTDVNEAQSRLDLTVAQEIAARNDLEFKRHTLEKLIRRPLPALAALGNTAIFDVIAARRFASLVEKAPAQSLQVAASSLNRQIASRELGKQEAGHSPTVDLVTSVGGNRNASYGAFGGVNNNQVQVGLEVKFPIYEGGAITSRVREALANHNRAEHELENTKLQATLDAKQAHLSLESAVAMQQALQRALTSAETQIQSTRRGMEVGVRTRIDVLNAQQQFFVTRRDLSAARYQILVATLQLKAAAGLLGEEDLKAMDSLLSE